ncbi:MAG: magnesium transporter [Acidobacteria bacterium]|nr:magnesium transporter [Acidobacteriota bacterium]
MAYLRKLDVATESARKLARMRAGTHLANLLKKLRPADIASIFSGLTEQERLFAFNLLLKQNEDLVTETLGEMEPEDAAHLLAHLDPPTIAKVLQRLPTDDATLLASELPPELFEQVMDLMHVDQSADVLDQLQYEEHTAGRIMTPNVFALHEDMTVSEAIATLQRKSDELEMVFYVYVVDDRHHLVGVVSLRELLLNPPSMPLKKIMTTDVISMPTSADQEEVARIVGQYNLVAVPIVDEENRLVGMVTVDDVVDVLREEATEDIYSLAGVATDERVTSPPLRSLRLRLPWLHVNLITAVLASVVVYLFSGTIRRVVALAVLMPIVAGMGGNAAIQTLTVTVRGLALGELTWANRKRVILKEVLVGIGNGVVLGLVTAIIAWFWFQRPVLGVVIGLAMIANMFVAGLMGVVIPLVLKRLKADPAVASGIFVTTFTDVCGFFSFLGLATLLLKWIQ